MRQPRPWPTAHASYVFVDVFLGRSTFLRVPLTESPGQLPFPLPFPVAPSPPNPVWFRYQVSACQGLGSSLEGVQSLVIYSLLLSGCLQMLSLFPGALFPSHSSP